MSAIDCLIVGGGQAALSAAAKLRELDSDITIRIVSADHVLPYQLPPLSKAYLSGEMPLDRLLLRPAEWYVEQRIDVTLGREAISIDTSAKTVSLDDGSACSFDKLLLATGSIPRKLSAEIGGDLEGVFTLRSSSHSDAIRPLLIEGNRLVIVGGGYIGLEVAAVAVTLGLRVTVVEIAERILQRVAAPVTSDFFRDLHIKHGVEIRESCGLDRVEGLDGRLTGVLLNNGERLDADLVLVGIGVAPNTSLAEQAGLEADNGVVVDEYCQTSDPNIFAAGDCANFPHHGSRARLESVPNALHQAEVAAENMVGGSQPYIAAPWFWSDQYNVKLQIAGLNTGYTQTVVRPGKREGSQSVWYYKGDDLLAVDAMNDGPAFMIARRIIGVGKSVPMNVVADPAANLKEWV